MTLPSSLLDRKSLDSLRVGYDKIKQILLIPDSWQETRQTVTALPIRQRLNI